MNQENSLRNIVICSDGTGNTFDESVSNVTRLIQLIELDEAQIAVYDQGIGTNTQRLEAFNKYRDRLANESQKNALIPLPGPATSDWLSRALGLVFGWGLKDNVQQLYEKLSRLYRGPQDRIFLFGFSRGAFTVRALAGLIYRCGLPRADVEEFDARFEEAWKLYQPHLQDDQAGRCGRARAEAFRSKYCRKNDLEIHFLGIWDTVKSYGGINPVSLPHLRHNPMVRNIRHALALDEKRSWFNATTWGQLDLDETGAKKRLDKDPGYQTQEIKEVWFRGCHSDVGGGDEERVTAEIPLRWMLAEAVRFKLRLNDCGQSLLEACDPQAAPNIHESDRRIWRFVDNFVPRLEIDNSGTWPVKKWKIGRTGWRTPSGLLRNKTIMLHESVTRQYVIRYEETDKVRR